MRELNPGLVHCALSGYGQTGPARYASGHDVNYQAITGGLNQCGTPERPVIPFPPIADYAGAMQAVLTILGALLGRAGRNEGCFIDVSMAESLLQWNAISFNAPMRRAEGLLNGGVAFYQIYATADGRFITLSPIEPRFWDNFCNAVERPEWIPRRSEPLPQTALIGEVARLFASRSLAEWDAILAPADCCYQAVLDLSEVPEHPQVRARGMIERRGQFTDVLFPALVDGAEPVPRMPPDEAPLEAVLARWQAR